MPKQEIGKTVLEFSLSQIKEAMKNDLLALRPDTRPANENRPGSEQLGPENFGRLPGNYWNGSISIKTC